MHSQKGDEPQPIVLNVNEDRNVGIAKQVGTCGWGAAYPHHSMMDGLFGAKGRGYKGC